jgi:hypothetical protein
MRAYQPQGGILRISNTKAATLAVTHKTQVVPALLGDRSYQPLHRLKTPRNSSAEASRTAIPLSRFIPVVLHHAEKRRMPFRAHS